MIEGLSHITLIVRDLEKSARIVTEILGGIEIYDSKTKNYSTSREKFFDVYGLWIVLMEGDALPAQTYNHVAFKIAEEKLSDCLKKVQSLDLRVVESRSRQPEEGQSIYFYDYDNHLFELHTGTLSQRLQFYNAQ